MTKTYDIKMIHEAPNWDEIEPLALDVYYEQTPRDIKAFAQICCNEDAFFLHLKTEEKNILKEEAGPLGMPCNDSCLEFFFRPEAEDLRYFNIEYNANGCAFLGFGSDRYNLVRLLPKAGAADGVNQIFTPEIKEFEGGWEIFYKIPFDFIRNFFPGFKVYEGKELFANCYKCADKTNPPNYLSWNELTSDSLDFHAPCEFGKMTLVK